MEAIFIKNPYFVYTIISVSLINQTPNRKNFYYLVSRQGIVPNFVIHYMKSLSVENNRNLCCVIKIQLMWNATLVVRGYWDYIVLRIIP